MASSVSGEVTGLLAPNPTRDARFKVVERWADCANFPPDHSLREIEFFHRQMNEEVDSLECCARHVSDFPTADWTLRLGLARQCADEARHAAMFRRIFESRGGQLGQYPVINFQYRIVVNIETLVGRMAVQNRSFEAGGLDAIESGIRDAQAKCDEALVELYRSQQADEISHVRLANDWIRTLSERDPRAVLQIGVALSIASKGFAAVMGPEATEAVAYPADSAGRREAGFTEEEVRMAVDLQGGATR